MTQEHPITPPQWQVDAWCKQALAMGADVDAVFLEAARWGADMELEACCEWFRSRGYHPEVYRDLLAARRKPPSLKEQALQALCRFDDTEGHDGLTQEQIAEDFVTIRRALDALPD